MAVTVVKEDGTGLDTANSYATVAEAALYLEQTGRSAIEPWLLASTDQKGAALIVGTQYMDTVFRVRYVGCRAAATADTQALEWPRDEVYAPSGAVIDSADIPVEIGQTAIEYALASLTDDLDVSTTSGEVKRLRQKVGPIETETEYATAVTLARIFPRATRILSRWLRPVYNRTMRA